MQVRRLKERGINYGEFTFHKDEVLKTTARAMAVLDDSSNCDVVDFIMVNDELGQTIMEEWEADQSLAAIDSTITLEEVINCFILSIYIYSSFLLIINY